MTPEHSLNGLTKKKGVSDSDIVIFGESLGTGVAVQVASEKKYRAVILVTPFSSMIELASNRYFFVPVKYLLQDCYMNIDKIQAINAPLLILQGHKDRIVPFDLAKKLYDAAKDPKKMIEFPYGEHNNLLQFGAHKDVLDFLSGVELNR